MDFGFETELSRLLDVQAIARWVQREHGEPPEHRAFAVAQA